MNATDKAYHAFAEREMPWLLDEATDDSEKLVRATARTAFQCGLQASDQAELLAALQVATAALAGGLWDYGPGQDEHEKCNEVIAQCCAVIAKFDGSTS